MPLPFRARRSRELILGALAVGFLAVKAGAVVIQINGVVVPTEAGTCPGAGDKCLQSGLNVGEGFAANATNNPLDAQFNAATVPELFTVPKDSGGKFKTVTVYYLQHGAGYNNAFGWYNADDPATRNQVFVGTEKANNSVPDLTISKTLDFQALCAPNAGGTCTGAYHGGAIGFYLFVPNDNNRLYYTQKELNADGNYVHFLVYSSLVDLDPVSKQPLSYYFGFEDLFRGGDNDFDDSAFKVNGLVVPCQKQAEVCDGKDNNCDGIVDNVDYSGKGPCFPPGYPAANEGVGICQGGTWTCANVGGVYQDQCNGATFPAANDYCDGKDNNCNGQVDEGGVDPSVKVTDVCPADALAGECDATIACLNGKVACQVLVGPASEICDGKDNNCDGQVDEVTGLVDINLLCNCTGRVDESLKQVPSGQPCAGPSIGECKSGLTVCTNAQLSCAGYVGPTPEVCDGKDNDCNGKIDDGLSGLGTCAPTPPPGVHVCTPGVQQCINGVLVCSGYTLGSPELCNGKDDDCDGTIDDSPIDVGLPCGNTLGICQGGTTACVSGKIQCTGIGQGPKTEVCNGLDDNCNGVVDENTPTPMPGVGDPCTASPGCTGTKVCVAGQLQCAVTSGTTEVCNGKDDDCNGIVDDNPVDVGGVCSTSITAQTGNKGECRFGTLVCDPATHAPKCVGEVGPQPETCNGKDDNCDGFIDNDTDGTGPFVLSGDIGGKTVYVGEACGGGADAGDSGCLAGSFICKDGTMVCDSNSTIRVEVCNGIDDDCDGLVDESTPQEPLPRVGDACGSAFPPCTPGTLACVSGKLECQGQTDGTTEVCNGIDDDCNGIVDDPPTGGFTGEGDPCAAPGVTLPVPPNSLCRAGKMRCYDGKMQCIGAVGPFQEELCNGIDDTCDGLIDENASCPDGTQCTKGACRTRCSGSGEFVQCPGGLVCDGDGFCVPPSNGAGGTGGADSGTGAGANGTGANGAGANGTGANGAGANGTGANGAGANANSGGTGGPGTDGGNGQGGTGNSEQSGDGGENGKSAFGLATGGGGLHCSFGTGRTRGSAPVLTALALGLMLARRNTRRGRKEVSR
jgi:hypothetical protein